ncbi:MAG: response regulator [Chloroflexota bacterium]
MNLLFADDNATIRRLMQHCLAPESVNVTLATNAEEVEALSQHHPFDLIILDHHMPPSPFGGMVALKHLKQQCSDTPVILISAYVTRKDISLAQRHGASAYIAKEVLAFPPVLKPLLSQDWLTLQQLQDNKSLWAFPENVTKPLSFVL